MAVTLNFIPPFEPGIFAFLAARAVTGVEEASGNRYARTLQLPSGHGWFEVVWDGTSLLLEYDVENPRDSDVLLQCVRQLFNLDHDPVSADAAVAKNPVLAPRVEALPGIRLPGCTDPAEILIRAMIGQQITVAAARTQLNQLTVLATPSRLPHGTMTHFFPTPAQIATGAALILRGPKRRIESIMAVAAHLADGTLSIGAHDSPESLATKLLPISGIGPWTVGYVSMRVLGNGDVFLPTDAAVRNGYGLLRGETLALARTIKADELSKMADPLRPWRSYVTMHLWRAAGEGPKAPQRARKVHSPGSERHLGV